MGARLNWKLSRRKRVHAESKEATPKVTEVGRRDGEKGGAHRLMTSAVRSA